MADAKKDEKPAPKNWLQRMVDSAVASHPLGKALGDTNKALTEKSDKRYGAKTVGRDK